MVYRLYYIDHLTFQLLTQETKKVDKKGDNPVTWLVTPEAISFFSYHLTLYHHLLVSTAVNHVMIDRGWTDQWSGMLLTSKAHLVVVTKNGFFRKPKLMRKKWHRRRKSRILSHVMCHINMWHIFRILSHAGCHIIDLRSFDFEYRGVLTRDLLKWNFFFWSFFFWWWCFCSLTH